MDTQIQTAQTVKEPSASSAAAASVQDAATTEEPSAPSAAAASVQDAATTEEPSAAAASVQDAATTEEPSAAASVQEPSASSAASVQEQAATTEEPSAAVQDAATTEEPSAASVQEQAATTEEPSASSAAAAAAASVQDATTTEEPSVKEPAKAAAPLLLQLQSPWSTRLEPSEQHDVRLRLMGRGYNLDVWCDESAETRLVIGAAFELLHRQYDYQDAHRAELEEAARKLHEARRTCPKQGLQLRVSSRDYDVGLRLSNDVPSDLMVTAMVDLVLACALRKYDVKGAESRKAETANVTSPTPGVHLYLTGIGAHLSVWMSNDVDSDKLVGATFEMLNANVRNDLDVEANRCAVSQDVELFVMTAASKSKLWIFNKDQPTVLSTAACNTLADHLQKKQQQAQDQPTLADQAERAPVKIEKPSTEMAIEGNSYKLTCIVSDADDEFCDMANRITGLVRCK